LTPLTKILRTFLPPPARKLRLYDCSKQRRCGRVAKPSGACRIVTLTQYSESRESNDLLLLLLLLQILVTCYGHVTTSSIKAVSADSPANPDELEKAEHRPTSYSPAALISAAPARLPLTTTTFSIFRTTTYFIIDIFVL